MKAANGKPLFWLVAGLAAAMGLLTANLAPSPEEEIEIAPYMGELQRFSQKLGFAMKAHNKPLSDFYLQEVSEVLDHLKTVKEHDGFPIGETVVKIMDPIMGDLKTALEKDRWQDALTYYPGLIEGCNNCHAATEHEYIQITPAEGKPPFNQKFTP